MFLFPDVSLARTAFLCWPPLGLATYCPLAELLPQVEEAASLRESNFKNLQHLNISIYDEEVWPTSSSITTPPPHRGEHS